MDPVAINGLTDYPGYRPNANVHQPHRWAIRSRKYQPSRTIARNRVHLVFERGACCVLGHRKHLTTLYRVKVFQLEVGDDGALYTDSSEGIPFVELYRELYPGYPRLHQGRRRNSCHWWRWSLLLSRDRPDYSQNRLCQWR